MEGPIVLENSCGAGQPLHFVSGPVSLYTSSGFTDLSPAGEITKGVAPQLVEETTTSVDEWNVSSGSKEVSPSQEPALSIFQKITKLSSSVQDLKNDHAILTDEVKKITTGFFVQPEGVSALQLLGKENGHLKKKFVQESTERKRLYNEVIELKGNIRVFCRCIPIN